MRLRALALPLAAMLASGASHAQPERQSFDRSAANAGVELRWRVGDGSFHGCMRAATTGWITVGFNTHDGLSGARLVMGRVVNGRVQVQVHKADPPRHQHRLNADGSERVTQVSSSYSNGQTQVCFTMPLKAQDAQDIGLVAGQVVYLILAWSHEADFDHHSAQRGSVRVVL
jgi:DOMON domain